MKFIGAHIFDYDATFRGDVTIEGNLTISNSVSQTISFGDNDKLYFGDGNDFEIYHDGTDTFINNATGHVYFKNAADDKDIEFQCDNGSGGTTPYIRIDGSATNTKVYKDMRFNDNVDAQFGSNGDLQVLHDGTNSYISNSTGNLFISNNTDDGDIIFRSDDGSGGLATYFQLDGSQASSNYYYTKFPDKSSIVFGDSNDLRVYHDSTDSSIENETGNLYIQQKADDKDIIFRCDDGSGGVTAYITLDGSVGNTYAYKDIRFVDDVLAIFGTSGDYYIKHDGSNMTILNNTGNMAFYQATDDADMVFYCDDGSGGLTAYITLDGSHTRTKFNKKILVADSEYVGVGDGADLQIMHNGTNTLIDNITGDLYIRNFADDKDIIFASDNGSGGTETYFFLDGSAGGSNPITIFPDNSYLKFGSSSDLSLHHNGSSSISYIENSTGDLNIINYANDKDIIFQSDDGSGGNTAYITLDGSQTRTNIHKNLRFDDIVRAEFGNSGDLVIIHDGTDSRIENGSSAGDLKIQNAADDKDILFRCDDGAGGVTDYFKLHGSAAEHNGSATTALYTVWPDNSRVAVGTSRDLQLDHNGTDSVIRNETGDLYIMNKANDKDIIFQSDDGSGGTTPYITLDGSAGYTTVQKHMVFADSASVYLGTGADLQLVHDGSNSTIQNNVGNLTIRQDADDGDIVFKCDDGSGGVETYFFLDGSAGGSDPVTRWPDSSRIQLGTSGDADLYHDGTDTYFYNSTGDLKIINYADDKDIIFQSDNGSGGVETYFFLDGSLGSDPYTIFPDSSILALGTGYDLRLYHDGSNSYVRNTTGNLIIQAATTDGDLILQSDDGSGGETAYITLDGSAGHTVANKEIQFLDNSVARFGTGNDVAIYHDGSNSFIDSNTGNLNIRHYADDGNIVFQCDDGSGGTTEYFRLDGGDVKTIFSKPIEVGADNAGNDVIFYGATSGRYMHWDESADKLLLRDNVKGVFGNASDLQIFHDASNSYIYHGGTGNLYIKNETNDQDVILQCDDGSGGITAYLTLDGSVARTLIHKEIRTLDNIKIGVGSSSDMQLYHNGSNTFITNGTGDLTISNTADDKDIIFQCDDGSGGATAYITLDGGAGHTTVQKEMQFENNVPIRLGTSNASQMSHDSSSGFYFANAIGDVDFYNHQDDGDISFFTDNGSGGSTEYLRLDGGDLSVNILTQKLVIANLPTSDPGVSGQVWNNNGVLNISAGG